eukprot:m.81840 g.81840  ORF g.81840 m.81840 type:complete len:82 (-) comp50753_c0_seq6:29-274(-)
MHPFPIFLVSSSFLLRSFLLMSCNPLDFGCQEQVYWLPDAKEIDKWEPVCRVCIKVTVAEATAAAQPLNAFLSAALFSGPQ